MLPIPVIKLGAQIMCGLGATKIVNDIIRNQVTIVTTADALKVWAGSLVISSMIVEQSSRHIDRVVTDVSNLVANKKTEESQVSE
jgi:hypothetical protein